MALQSGSHVAACTQPCRPAAGGVAVPTLVAEEKTTGSHRRSLSSMPGCAWCEQRLGLAGSQPSSCHPPVGSSKSFVAKETPGSHVLTAYCCIMFLPFQKGTDACGVMFGFTHRTAENSQLMFCAAMIMPFDCPTGCSLQPTIIQLIRVKLTMFHFSMLGIHEEFPAKILGAISKAPCTIFLKNTNTV